MMTVRHQKIETAEDQRHPLAEASLKLAPVGATTTVLLLAKLWSANGAAHSTGDAFLVGALTVGTALAGLRVADAHHGDPTTTAMTLATAGCLAFAGAAAYSNGWGLPLVLWAVSTVLAYVFGARYWREDRRARVQHRRRMEADRTRYQHVETVEAIKARALIETAHLELATAQASTAQANLLVEALCHRAPQLPSAAADRAGLAAAIEARRALPGFDTHALLTGTAIRTEV